MEGKNAVPSRQRNDRLWESTALLGSGGTFTGAIRRVSGYEGLNILIFSNLAFRLRIEEACDPDGTFEETERLTSVANPDGTAEILELRFAAMGPFARIFVDNLGGATQTTNVICVEGIPIGAQTNVNTGGGAATPVEGQPGTVITTPADTTVGVGATVALPTAPAGTRRVTVQVTGGDSTTRIRIREVAAGAGRGKLLDLLGSTMYGGADGAIAALEAENVAGPAAAVMVQFERD